MPKGMKKLFLAVAVSACALSAQTAETIAFRALLSSANEVPPVSLEGAGEATVWLHVVRDSQGRVTGGTVDFDISVRLPADSTITGAHIHRGTAAEAGPVTVSTGISGNAPAGTQNGNARIRRSAQVPPDAGAAIDTLNGMLSNPAGFYVNVHTSAAPAGIVRGQLQRADVIVLMTRLLTRNEVPPIGETAQGVATITAIATRDASGTPTSGRVIFDVTHTGLPEEEFISGLHIHNGPAGVNAGVTINSGIGSPAVGQVAANSGPLHFETEVPMNNALAVDTLSGLFTHPQDYYTNLHTRTFPGGIIRGQLRFTDAAVFPVTMTPANEVPAITGLDATGIAVFTVHTIRDNQGAAEAATVIFDVNHRFPANTQFTGMHIHNGNAATAGPVSISSGVAAANTPASESGAGNIFRIVQVTGGAALDAVNSLLANPENHYLNLHTSTHPAGAVRAQLAAPGAALPRISAVLSAISIGTARTVAPGGLVVIRGSDLVRVATGSAGLGSERLPPAFNGTQVTIAGINAPLLFVSPVYIVAQVPNEVAAGDQRVIVRTPAGASEAATVTVAATAPAIFVDANGGIFLKNSGFTQVTRENPARAGEVILIYATGLGLTNPVIETALLPPVPRSGAPLPETQRPVVRIGGREASVIYSTLTPGFAGLNQIAVTVPSGAGSGAVPVTIQVGEAISNSAIIFLAP